jgi:hypothetical protein
MIRRFLKIGFVSVLLIIIIQTIAVFYELLGIKETYLRFSMNGLNSLLNILVLIILWNALVKFYKQTQLDYILKSMIVIFTIVSIFSLKIGLDLSRIGIILLIAASLINVILYFIFINRIMEIDKSEISQIEQLKNYGLAFVICLLGQFILIAVIEFAGLKNLNFINHFLIMIPMLFIGLFFLRTKNEMTRK